MNANRVKIAIFWQDAPKPFDKYGMVNTNYHRGFISLPLGRALTLVKANSNLT